MKNRSFIYITASLIAITSCTTPRHAANIDYYRIDASYGYEGILEERFHDCSVPGPSRRRMYVYLPSDY